MRTQPEFSNRDFSESTVFYRGVLSALAAAGVPHLVGGGYALFVYTGISRMTKDLDLFILPSDVPHALEVLSRAGFETELTYSHWLAKARRGDDFVDLIFNSGNGRCPVDDAWYQNASDATIGGLPVRLTPLEEMIWQKAFIMERERFDGADIAHLLRVRSRTLNWDRLLRRFGPDWRVLYSHLILFGYIYPGEQSLIPVGVVQELSERLREELDHPPPPKMDCAGTLLSREQYLVDVDRWNHVDVRLQPEGPMTRTQIADWTP